MRRLSALALLASLLLFLTGCGGHGEKDKFKDKNDMPKKAATADPAG